MTLYYAPGGGLGHLTRARRLLRFLSITGATIVTSSPFAADARITGGAEVAMIPSDLEGNPAAHRGWLETLVRERGATRMIVDSFPAGIQGELQGVPLAPRMRLDLVARLLKPEAFARVAAPRFDDVYLVEELPPAQRRFVASAGAIVECDLLPIVEEEERAAAAVSLPKPYWIVAHSAPAEEVRQLVDYASELRELGGSRARLLVATQSDPGTLSDFAERIDIYPVSALVRDAERIVTACGFNAMLETGRYAAKRSFLPFPRRFDDQFERAARWRRRHQEGDS
jgi:hypothetical protein